MKRILTLCFLLPIAFLNAQAPYHPMLVEGRSWDVFEVPTEIQICPYESAGHYFLNGDTLLDGVVYKKLDYYSIRSSPPVPFCGGFYLDTSQVYPGYTFCREDTLARKVYGWSSNENPHEQLLYDFSLQAGDTLQYQSYGYPILSVSDWVLANGETRKAFEIGGGWASNYYVEGVGYLVGQFGQVYYPFEGLRALTCMRDGEEVIFSDGGVGCVYPTSSTQTLKIQPLEVSPNPFSEYLTLSIPAGERRTDFVFELYDLAGRIVFQKEIKQESDALTVNLPPLPRGVYSWAVDGFLRGKVLKM